MKSGIRALSCALAGAMLFGLAAVPAAGEEAAAEASGTAEQSASLPVEVKAKSAVLMDLSTGKVLLAQNEHEQMAPASVTKIMTLLLIAEAIDAGDIARTDVVTASTEASQKGGSQIWLKEGEQMTVDELLRATAIASANDASTALAEHLCGSEQAFVDRMNTRAGELGMADTHFENCTGLDDTAVDHVTSAYDIAVMSRELMLHHSWIQEYTTVWMDSLRDGATQLVNTNKLIRFYSGATGLKTGTTAKAGSCLSATATRENTSLVAVVMGCATSNDRFDGAKAMLNWGFSNYELFTPEIDLTQIAPVNVVSGVTETITPSVSPVSPLLIPKGAQGKIVQKIELAVDVEAPVEEGQVLGKVLLTLDDETLGTYDLIAPQAVKKMDFLTALKKLFACMAR